MSIIYRAIVVCDLCGREAELDEVFYMGCLPEAPPIPESWTPDFKTADEHFGHVCQPCKNELEEEGN